MPKFFDKLSDELIAFIQRQRMFFTATAPPLPEGRINLSPKGMDTFRVLDNGTVAYLDVTGSGNETAAHLKHDPNHRITVMFCSFDEQPKILRLYGRGRVVRERDAEWGRLSGLFGSLPGTRQIIVITIASGQTSCGFGVPMYEHKGERTLMREWAEKKGEAGLRQYRADNNAMSIDGLATGHVE